MFHKARLKLTAWYLLIIMLVSISFSFIIFNLIARDVERVASRPRVFIQRPSSSEFQQNPADGVRFTASLNDSAEKEFVEEIKGRVVVALSTVNVVIFFIAGVFGYFLAGVTLKPIQQMIDEQHRFITDASHELKTPLTALKTSLEVHLRDRKMTVTDAKKVLTESIENVNELQSLSESLLFLASHRESQVSNSFSEVSLKHVIREAMAKVHAMTKKKQIVINDKTRQLVLKGNYESMVHLFVIFFDNAIKYSKNRSAITITNERLDGYALIHIKDEGIGIARSGISHIFERFYRVERSRSKNGSSGYGLGLSIAAEIVNMHRGSIDVQSEVNKGTTFTIKLPILTA